MGSSYLSIEVMPIAALRPYSGDARTHSTRQVRQIADSIQRFRFTNPVLISDDNEIVAGHGRVLAAKELGIAAVPSVKLSHLSAEERRAYVLADNKLALNAGWDMEIFAVELQALVDIDVDVTLTGFSLAEVDLTLDRSREASPSSPDAAADLIPPLPATAVTRTGDLWQLGSHRLLCGDAHSPEDVGRLVGEGTIDLIFTDLPYDGTAARIPPRASGPLAGRIAARQLWGREPLVCYWRCAADSCQSELDPIRPAGTRHAR
ncbi:ParB/Srx family N-terminal domain-containing protein [Mesorhizobium sp. BR1-1-16]|uniref:ParB/Srx family N-terminal domain-containing protein n=1 Tax=Mesorhizobium sp. BR1-1-16 TaxID=2876653 RepID=UPI001CCC6672|nr:ParB/Srx family N-terminal domain-containing protein [Mesorhizobium sp. BR1-1-16]MBZ9939232.1 ParB/Srx family N-terminal domain-containing protein [Mesorhizobium sp. BR1-1-16]